jgi:hypothetical protein
MDRFRRICRLPTLLLPGPGMMPLISSAFPPANHDTTMFGGLAATVGLMIHKRMNGLYSELWNLVHRCSFRLQKGCGSPPPAGVDAFFPERRANAAAQPGGRRIGPQPAVSGVTGDLVHVPVLLLARSLPTMEVAPEASAHLSIENTPRFL